MAGHFREGTGGRAGTSCTAGIWRSTGSHEELDGRCDSPLLPELRERVCLTKLLSSAFLEVELEHYLLGQRGVIKVCLFRLRGRRASNIR